MSVTGHPEDDLGGSPPCLMHELGAGGGVGVDPVQARDVARWRKAERERLIAARMALPAELRATQTQAMAEDLDRLIPEGAGTIVSVYWPIRAEPDLRRWMRARRAGGTRIALPVALELGRPLVFREWHPDAPMARGLWQIPIPADSAPAVVPTVVIAPLVGFDAGCYRLGYGGGFFDRTLAAIAGKPLVIGVGYSITAIPTIYPQPHDIPMDWIVTGLAPPVQRSATA
jgi:5,10-methenyltetrahydrofolate synthetase